MTKPIKLAIDGHDGAGKTPIVHKLCDRLEALGYQTKIVEPFLLANAHLGENIYPYWKSNPKMATRQMQSILEQKPIDNPDIIVYDRHWLSIAAQLHNTELEKSWTDFIPTIYMQAPIEKTISCDRFSWSTPWTQNTEQLQYWIETYNLIAKKYPQYILASYTVKTRQQPLDPIVDDILDKLTQKKIL